MNRLKVFLLSICAIICTACAQSPLKVEVAPQVFVAIPTPDSLKLVEGIYATYEQGTLLIDTQYLDNMSGDQLLSQIYGDTPPASDNIEQQKQVALKDAQSVQDISKEKVTAYLINHRMGYELLVMAPNGEKYVTYITGKNVATLPIYESIKE